METQKLGSEWQLTQERAICVLNKNLHLIMKQNFNLSFCNDTQISHNIKKQTVKVNNTNLHVMPNKKLLKQSLQRHSPVAAASHNKW